MMWSFRRCNAFSQRNKSIDSIDCLSKTIRAKYKWMKLSNEIVTRNKYIVAPTRIANFSWNVHFDFFIWMIFVFTTIKGNLQYLIVGICESWRLQRMRARARSVSNTNVIAFVWVCRCFIIFFIRFFFFSFFFCNVDAHANNQNKTRSIWQWTAPTFVPLFLSVLSSIFCCDVHFTNFSLVWPSILKRILSARSHFYSYVFFWWYFHPHFR